MLPLVIWIIALAGVVSLYVHRTQSFHVVGIASSQTCTFTATESGFLISLPIQLNQQVRRGQRLAVLRLVTDAENQYNRAQIEVEKAAALTELERLKADAQAAEQQFRLDHSRQQIEALYRDHQLALDVEKVRLLILEIRTTLEPLKIQLRDLELEKQVLRNLLDKKAIEPYELQKIEVQAAAMTEQIDRQQEWLEQTRQDLEEATRRLETFRASRPSAMETAVSLEPLRKAIAVQEKHLAELFVPDAEIVFTAPFDGVVSQVYYTEGQTVIRDLPIVTITAPVPEKIVAWLDQDRSGTLILHQPVEIIKTSLPRKILQSEISQIGPAIELMPERLWKDPAIPQWGHPVIIPLHPDMQLRPNEIVGVRGI